MTVWAMNTRLSSIGWVKQVKLIRAAAEKLRVMGADFPAVDRNALRILDSVKMIELNLGDAA